MLCRSTASDVSECARQRVRSLCVALRLPRGISGVVLVSTLTSDVTCTIFAQADDAYSVPIYHGMDVHRACEATRGWSVNAVVTGLEQ